MQRARFDSLAAVLVAAGVAAFTAAGPTIADADAGVALAAWKPDVHAARAYAERRLGEVCFAVRTDGHLYGVGVRQGGWGSGSGAVDHQVALLRRGRRRLSVAILTTNSPSHAYAKAPLRGVAARLLRRLGTEARPAGRRHGGGGARCPFI